MLRDSSGKPIENAAVIFHLVGDKGNMELKSNEDGKAVIDVLPQGSSIQLQVIAKGFQTYGEDYDLDKPEMAFEVRLKRPGEQYSIYKNYGVTSGKSGDTEKSASPAKDSAPAKDAAPTKDGASDKPASQPDAQPK